MKYHFASIETNDNLYLLKKVKPLYILASYFYLKKLKPEQLEIFFNYINSKDCRHFILDSGAFTYIMGSKKQKEFILNNTEEYIKEYANFIRKYNIKNYIELDLDCIFGYEKIKKIRAELEKQVGYKSMPVFHNLYRNKKDLDEMLENYKYICISNFNGKKTKKILPQIKAIVQYANQKGVKVHGLALTGKDFTSKVNFYSVDSSSWKSGIRFASIPKYDEINKKIVNSAISKVYKIKSDIETRNKLIEYSMKEWKKYQLYLDKQ